MAQAQKGLTPARRKTIASWTHERFKVSTARSCALARIRRARRYAVQRCAVASEITFATHLFMLWPSRAAALAAAA